MAYSNMFLRNFRPVFLGILREKQIRPERVALEVIDEEEDGEGIFEPVSVREVLEQLAGDLNFLSIYTERPAYFYEFAETMYEENGLVVTLFSKDALGRGKGFSLQGEPRRGGRRDQSRAGAFRQQGAYGGYAGRVKMMTELILDFEWEGGCYPAGIGPGIYYIPIHKKPWQRGENLDIMIPIGYNTVIIRGVEESGHRLARDRFEEAFYDS